MGVMWVCAGVSCLSNINHYEYECAWCVCVCVCMCAHVCVCVCVCRANFKIIKFGNGIVRCHIEHRLYV